MVNIIKSIHTASSVVAIGSTPNYILIIDNIYTLYVVDKNSFSIIESLSFYKQSNQNTEIHKYSRFFDISDDGDIAFGIHNTNKVILLKVGHKIEKKGVMIWHKGDVEIIKFGAKYLATGGTDGIAYIFYKNSVNPIASIFPRPDYISNIAFSNNSNLVGISSFDKSLVIFNLDSSVQESVIFTNDVIEKLEFFENENGDFIYFVCRDGVGGIYNVTTKELVSTYSHFVSWPTSLIIYNNLFAIVGGKGNIISIIKLEDNSRYFEVKLEKSGITNMQLYQSYLLIGFVDGDVDVVDFSSFVDELDDMLDAKEFKKVKAILTKNIFLQLHDKFITRFNEAWKSVLQEIIILLGKDEVDVALEKAEPFLDDEKREEEFNFYLSQRGDVKEFIEFVNSKKYKDAYFYANRYQYLQRTNAYKVLESRWNKAFSDAKNILEENPTINKKRVLEIFKEFEQVDCKKPVIASLVNNSDKFIEADKAIKKRDFKYYFALVAKYSFLKDSETYKRVLNLAEQLREKVVDYEHKQQFKEALETIDLLMNFIPYQKEAQQRIGLIKSKMRFIEAFEANDSKSAYEIAGFHPEIRLMPQFKELSKEFNKIVEKAMEEAERLNILGVLKLLQDFYGIPYLTNKIGAVMKFTYLQEIKQSKGSKRINWIKTLEEFIKRFGRCIEIERVCEELNISQIYDSIQLKGRVDGYKSIGFIDSILIEVNELS